MNFILNILILLLLIALAWRLGSKRYRLPCPSWLSWLVELDNPFAKENRAGQIISHLKITKGMHVADVGCGAGRVTIPLALKVGPRGKLVAIDMQQAMLDKIEDKVPNSEIIELRKGCLGSGESILEDDTYDYVLLVNVLGEIPHKKAALQEIFYALKPEAILSVTETIFDPHFQSVSVLKKLATSVGLKKVAIFGSWYSYTAHFVAEK